MNQCPCLEGQQGFILFGDRIPWKPVFLILPDGIPDVLGQVGLEFGGGYRKTVHEKSQVKRVLVMSGIVQLTDNGQSVGRIVGPEVRIGLVGGSELAERESCVPVLEAVSKEKKGSVFVELFADSFQEDRIGVAIVPTDKLGPLGRLGFPDEFQKIFGIKSQFFVVFGVGSFLPAMGPQVFDEFLLEDVFLVDLVEVGHRKGGSR